MDKGVSEIIAVVLIVVITTSLVGTALMWGLPLISKRQDSSVADRVYNYFNRENANSIVRKIEFVSVNGGQATFISDVSGGWIIHGYDESSESNNSLEFVTMSKVSNVAVSTSENNIEWVSLTPGGSCPPDNGIVGLDPSYVVCAKAVVAGEGFELRYRIWFRELYDSANTKIWKVNLMTYPNGESSAATKTIKISQGDITTGTQDGKTLIATEIKILLV